MRRRALGFTVPVAAMLVMAACATTRPPAGEPLAPLTATTADEAMRQLETRANELAGARSLMRMRATSGDRVQSFKAQLQIDRRAMLLTAYTPLNTTALRLYADDNGVVFLDDMERTAWRGSAGEFARSFGFFGELTPRDAAKLLLGLPPSRALSYQATPAGLARVTAGDVVIAYDPPSFPPSHVTVARGAQKLDVETLGTAASSDSVAPLSVPKDYRCCVAPRI